MKTLVELIVPILVVVSLVALGDAPSATVPVNRTMDDSVHTVSLASVGNLLKYSKTAFTVKAGEKVHLTFENQATTPGISHNVVILKLGVDSTAIQRVGIAALQAAATDYIPKDDAILFHTPLAAAGKTVELDFQAPAEPGEYPFLCTFPGHFVTMHGVMTVTKDE